MSVGIGDDAIRYQLELLAEVLEHAETEGQEAFVAEAFTDLVLDDLEQEGRWPDYQLAHLNMRGARVDAWALDEDRRLLFLAVTDFDRTSVSATIPRSEIQRAFSRLSGFLSKARLGRIDVPDHSPVADLLEVVGDTQRYDEVRAYVLTHRVAPDGELESDVVDGIAVKRRIWDLETIRRSREIGARPEPIDIDFLTDYGGGLPYLSAKEHETVRTFLLFMPALVLAGIYQEHGARLLERNVRAFLSARGKINRGIRDTLRTEPERFLAYNNGLTATAASVNLGHRDATPVIQVVSDLQIVNGGQTTASLAVAMRDSDVSLECVSVQVKLVVVGEDLVDEMVPNISRFANRQNAVQESDLSANHEYLRRLQEVSRTEWTPAASGRPTKWYFERARGSYAVDLSEVGTTSAQRRFLSEYPKRQKFGKNEVALYENTWSRLPHLVCRGGQKNFVEYMVRLPEPPAIDAEAELDTWHRERFRRLISKAIIFKAADRVVGSSYGGTYKRAVVAYTLAYLLEDCGTTLDLGEIWRDQQISAEFTKAIIDVAGPLKEELIRSAGDRNITEWAKQEECWKVLRACDFLFDEFASTRGDVFQHGRPPSQTGFETVTGGRPLADVIGEVHGEPIHGAFRRYRRRRWRYLGDTEVPTSGGESLHAYAAPMRGPDGLDYVFNVVVDFPLREILPLSALDQSRAIEVQAWLAQNGFPS